MSSTTSHDSAIPTTTIRTENAKFLRGEYKIGFWTIVSEWLDGSDEYLLLATHNPQRALIVAKYNEIREMWEKVAAPKGFSYLIESEGNRMNVPMESFRL